MNTAFTPADSALYTSIMEFGKCTKKVALTRNHIEGEYELNGKKYYITAIIEMIGSNKGKPFSLEIKELVAPSVPTREAVETAIRAAKWDRSSYEYALNHMLPHRCFSDSSIYKKAELIELFYEAIQTKWGSIKSFTTFKILT